jgi:Fe-S cluster assembly iron-binding protein IscA
MVYLIGLRLFSMISNNLFDMKLGEVSISQIKSINSDVVPMIQAEIQGEDLSYFDDRWDIAKIKLDSLNQDLKPFFYTPNIEIYSSLKLGELPQNLMLDEDNSTIMIGSLKYFTAPYLQCKQVGVLSSEGELKPLKGIKFDWWIQHSRIQDLLHHNIDKIKYMDVIEYIDLESLELNDFWIQATYKRILASLDFNDKDKYQLPKESQVPDQVDEQYAANLMLDLESSGFTFDDLELDFGDELLGDEQIIRNDTMEYEDTSGSSSSEDKKYVEYRTLDEFTKSMPYFINETNVTFSLSKPRSLDYLEFANKNIEKLIYESSKTTTYLFNVRPFHKLILFMTYLNNYKKWVSNNNVKEIKHNKLSMFLLYKVCEDLLETSRDFKVDYINDEYAVIQNDNKLMLTYFVSNPDSEDIKNVEESNSYYLTNGCLYLGKDLLAMDLPIDNEKEEVYVTIDEKLVKDFVSSFNVFVALGFVQKKWIKYYNLIETDFRTMKKQRLNDILKRKKQIDD